MVLGKSQCLIDAIVGPKIGLTIASVRNWYFSNSVNYVYSILNLYIIMGESQLIIYTFMFFIWLTIYMINRLTLIYLF